MLFYDKIQCEP